MLTKTYGMPHMMDASVLIPLNNGRTQLRVHFTGGIPTEEGEMPAKYSTSSEVEQMIIEGSSYFGRTIFQYDERGHKMDVAPTVPDKPTKKEGGKYPEITKIGEVVEKLVELGATPAELKDTNAVLAAAKKRSLVFPNLKLK